jgi:hypothetical protein
MRRGLSQLQKLGRDGPPLSQRCRVSLLVDFPSDKVAFRIKVSVDLVVDRDEFLERLRPTEFEHRLWRPLIGHERAARTTH